jgi:glycosyltransferase involved in cell wall biosynthesis
MNRVIYDYQIFLSQKYGGISRYFYELARRIERTPGFTADIYAPLYANSYLAAGTVNKWGFKVAKLPKIWRLYEALDRTLSYAYFAAAKPAIVHETYYSGLRLAPRRCPIVVTVYDMIHEKFGHLFKPGDPTSAFKRKSVDRADKIICISENTRRDLIDIFNVPEEKTVTVPLAFSLDVAGRIDRSTFHAKNVPYLLFVGNRDHHKNFRNLLKAYASSRLLQHNFSLIAFGGPAFSAAEYQLMDDLQISREKIERYSGGDALLAELYRGAAAFVYPSLYEGFGIPPLEAMSNDCPVVCSNTSSMPEVVGDAAVLFDPAEPDEIRRAIESVVHSQDLRDKLIAHGRIRVQQFSWDRCAAETAGVYSSVLNVGPAVAA